MATLNQKLLLITAIYCIENDESSDLCSTAAVMLLAMSTIVLRLGMATELDGVGVTTRTECWSERLRPAGHTRNRESLSSWWSHLKNDNQTQQQNRKQIEALLLM